MRNHHDLTRLMGRPDVALKAHAPARVRVNGVVRYIYAWYAACTVTPADALYLPPGERVRIW